MRIILDEKAKAEEVLGRGIIYENKYTTMKLLIKYWYIENGFRKVRLKKALHKYLEKNYKGYNEAKMQDEIEREINTYIRKPYPFNKVDCVSITKSELEHIKGLDNLILEKLAFTMLVYAKIMNQIIPENNNWINTDFKEIGKDAKVNGSRNRIYTYVHKINEYGGIYQTYKVDGDGVRIDFLNEDSEVEFVIDDFREFILEYLKRKGEDIDNCEVCNKKIIPYNNKKYCKDCATKIKMEMDRKRMEAIRKVES